MYLRMFSNIKWQSSTMQNSNYFCTNLIAQSVKNLPAVQETGVWSLGWKDPLEKEMVTHSRILAWKISWTEEPGGLQSMGSQRVRHNWVTKTKQLYENSSDLITALQTVTPRNESDLHLEFNCKVSKIMFKSILLTISTKKLRKK